MIKHAVIALILLTGLLSAVPAIAQDEPEENGYNEEEGRGYFMFGVNFLDVDELNNRLAAAGYAEMPSHYFSLGGGGHAILESGIVIGGEGHALLGQKESTGTFQTALGGGYGFFNIGYAVYRHRGLSIYPLLGIGGGSITMKITDSEAPLFDDILDDPKRSAELKTGGFLLDLSIGIDHLILTGDDDDKSGFMFGLRAGYTFSPTDSDWEMNGNQINGGPDMGITGPYVHLMIGGGGSGN